MWRGEVEYSILAMSLCVWEVGGCVQYISYEPVCVGGGEVVYSTLAMSLCVWGGGCVQYISYKPV